MAPRDEIGEDGTGVEELIGRLKRELLDLFDYSDIQGNRTMVRGDVVRALDGMQEKWRREGAGEWQAPRVEYKGITSLLDRFEKATRFIRPSFYLDTLNRASLRGRSLDVDDFGRDPASVERFDRFIKFLYEKYWRVSCIGVDHIPHQGPAMLVTNHSGTLPFDALMVSAAVRKEHESHRDARYLIEDVFMTVPFLSPLLTRIGAVRASRENAGRLLGRGEIVGVFPEGAKGISKLYRQRYQLQRFGRGGFVRLALSTGAPIIPVAVVGAEEIMPMIGKLETLPKWLGIPYLPITPLWPGLGLLGFIPLPTKWFIQFGQPIDVRKYGPRGGDDEILVNRIKEDVRAVIQEMLYDLLKNRASVWSG